MYIEISHEVYIMILVYIELGFQQKYLAMKCAFNNNNEKNESVIASYLFILGLSTTRYVSITISTNF